MLKLYDNCKELRVKGGRQVIGMESDEGEKFTLREQVKAEKPVEEWMTKVETEMMVSLKKITKEQVFHYAKTDRQQWVIENLSMTAIIGTQVWWTWRVEDVFRRVKDGNKHAMKQEAIK
jgi:dynein heavy chain